MAGGASLLKAITHAYSVWFFTRWMPSMTVNVDTTVSMLRMRSNAAPDFLDRLRAGVKIAFESQHELRQLTDCLSKNLANRMTPGEEWERSFRTSNSLVHDTRNIVGAYLMAVSLAEQQVDPGNTVRILEGLQSADFSSVHSIANLVAMLHRNRSRERGIRIQVGSMPHIVLPERQRVPFFRSLYELVHNARKYSDPGKTDRGISIEADIGESFVRIHVSDNGVGIRDLEGVLGNLRQGTSIRERPDLDAGEGFGIATIARHASEEKWGFYILSGHGIGTDAGFYIDRETFETCAVRRAPNRQRKHPLPPLFLQPGADARSNKVHRAMLYGALSAAALDPASMVKTVQIMGPSVGVYHFFPAVLVRNG
jgi:hypothetical protein